MLACSFRSVVLRAVALLCIALCRCRRRLTAAAGEAVTLQHALLQPLPGQVQFAPNKTAAEYTIPNLSAALEPLGRCRLRHA